MPKDQRRKDRKVQQLPNMIATGMTRVVAAVMFAARHRKWFHKIRGVQGVYKVYSVIVTYHLIESLREEV